jgi:hypothetical protein
VVALDRVAGLRFDPAELTRDGEATASRLNELVSGSAEHIELVRQLEQQVDAAEGEAFGRVSGDELAAELERFLRDQGG